MDPAEWIQIVRERLTHLCPARLCEELESEVLALLWMTACGPNGLSSVPAWVTKLIPRLVVRWLQEEERQRTGCVEPQVQAGPDTAACRFEAAALRELQCWRVLRGRREKWIVERLLSGCTCADMAVESGQPEKELRRKVAALALKIRRFFAG